MTSENKSKAVQYAHSGDSAGVVYALLYLGDQVLRCAHQLSKMVTLIENDINESKDKPGDLYMGYSGQQDDDQRGKF